MSQLQRDATRRQPSTGPGAAAAPGGKRAAARGPASIHGGRWAAATSEARGGGGKGTGPGPRYSQQVAAHGGGDQHRDDHPGETPALAREGPAPEPRRGTPQGAPTHPRFGPLGTNQGAAMPTRPQKAEKRTSGSAKLCAVMAAPHRTAPAHCRAPPAAAQRRQPAPPIGRSARLGPARIQSARLGSARPPHGSAARSAQEHPGRHRRFTNSFMLHSSHPPPPPAPSQPGWAHTVLRTRGSAAPASGGAAPGRAPPPMRYLGTLRSSLMSHSAMLSRAREPDWCVAATGVGTYSSRVLMPRPTCQRGRRGQSSWGCTTDTMPSTTCGVRKAHSHTMSHLKFRV